MKKKITRLHLRLELTPGSEDEYRIRYNIRWLYDGVRAYDEGRGWLTRTRPNSSRNALTIESLLSLLESQLPAMSEEIDLFDLGADGCTCSG